VTDSTSIKIEYLRSLGSMEVSHSGESLFDHLFGVQKNLRDMGAPEYLQDAGLFHSVYGTAIFKHQSTTDRDKVRELIGEQAEEVVFTFGSIPKPRQKNILAMKPSQLRHDLLTLNLANQDQMDDRRLKKFDV
jgi:hypothetical protein